MSLFLDCEPELQPKGTYRYAVNVVDDSVEGSQGALASEVGNFVVANLPQGQIRGVVPAAENHIVFLSPGKIILVKENSFDVLLDFPALNFTEVIKGEFRVVKGCEDIVYFYDGVNPDRFFNISRPEVHQTDGVYDINLFNLNPISSFPVFRTITYESGGLMELGKYFFAVQVTDQNENVIYTSQVSNGVTITDDEDGGLNIPVNLPQVGGVPKSNKSIQVDITNIGDYPFAKVIVFRAATADGVTYDVFKIGNLLPVDNGKISYLFTGINPTNDVPIVPEEVIVPKARYQLSKAQTQVDNRLIRANLVESVRDYSGYQKFASKIASNYVTRNIPFNRKEVITELGGEVKAYGICYVHRDGTISPVFHIPGPAKTEEDGEFLQLNITPVNIDPLVVYLTFEYSLVVIGDTTYGRYVVNYRFSRDITSGKIYFEDNIDFDLVTEGSITYTSYVRDPVLIPMSFIVNIGNVVYQTVIEASTDPFTAELVAIGESNTKQRWQIHSTGKDGNFGYYQTNENYINPPNFCGDDYWGVDSNNIPLANSPVRYHSIPDRNAEPIHTGSGLRAIGVSFTEIEYPNNDIVGHFFVTNTRNPATSVVSAKGIIINHAHRKNVNNNDNYSGRYFETGSTNFHKLITNEYQFDKRTVSGEYVLVENDVVYNTNQYTSFINNYFSNPLPYRDYRATLINVTVNNYTVIPRDFTAISDNYSIPYKASFENINNNSSNSNLNILRLDRNLSTTPKYVSIRLLRPVFPSVFNIQYRRLGNLNENIIYNGDAFISKLDMTNVSKTNIRRRFIADNVFEVEAEIIRNIYLESPINANYRHGGTDECNEYYKGGIATDYILKKTTELSENKPIGRTNICAEFYGYNKDFSYINTFNVYYPLGFTFNYCSDCLGIYPNRLIFSQKSFEEDMVDNYRNYLANDYVDIPANRGEIVSMNYYNGKIVIRTTETCFFLQPNPQQIQLSESTAYIGTGDFLSIPPQEMNVTSSGYAGQQNKIAEVITEHGLVWLDSLSGKIFKLSDKLEEISRNGMYHFFRKNLANFSIVGYDPLFERLVVNTAGGTVSYSFKKKGWTSFHDYSQQFYFNTKRHLRSTIGNAVLQHSDSQNYATFNSQVFEVGVEYTLTGPKAFNVNSIQYYMKAFLFGVDVPDATFTRGIVFNSNQTSGSFNIVVDNTEYGSINFSNFVKRVKITDKTHKLSGVYSIATQAGPGNELVPDYNTPQYKLAPFRDKFLRVRLFILQPLMRIIVNFVDGLKQEYER
jgi:hypothetical protein